MADALFSPFAQRDNLARMTFLDPAARPFFVRWDHAAEAVVAGLRHAVGLDPHYPRLKALIRELSKYSAEFTELWAAHTVRGKTRDSKELHHPDIGPLTLGFQSFAVLGAPGQQLVVYQAEPGSSSARGLALLGSLHATRRTS